MRCAFTGHRPNKLYGYKMYSRRYHQLNNRLYNLCEKLIEKKNVDTFISGGAIGFDLIAFQQINKLKTSYDIKNNMAIPFEKQDCKWNDYDRREYSLCKDEADELYYVDTIEGYEDIRSTPGEYSAAKMQLRNKFMVDNCDYLIACWDGIKKGGTWNCIKYALDKNKNILHIDPTTLKIVWLNEKN